MISDAELVIMKILWSANQPLASSQIIEKVSENWSPSTIKTLVHRLKKKEVLKVSIIGKEHLYSPKLQKDDFLKISSKSFFSKIFNSQLKPMVSHFIENENFSTKEIKEVEQLLSEILEQRKSTQK